jgi:hypothetical protein
VPDTRCLGLWTTSNTLAPCSKKYAVHILSKIAKGGMLEAYSIVFILVFETRYHVHPRYLPYPAKNISLRGVEEERYSVIDVTKVGQPGGQPKILEEVEDSRALFEVRTSTLIIKFPSIKISRPMRVLWYGQISLLLEFSNEAFHETSFCIKVKLIW